MIKSNSVKALLKADKPAFGTWITLCPHPRVVKIFAACGFDFVIVEMEHTDFNMETVGGLVMLAREAGIVPFVRPTGTIKPHDMTRPLDAGAQGLLLPSIDTAEQMAAIVKATKYYPMGNRPMNLRGPHTDYSAGDAAEITWHINEETMLVAMIESQVGIDNLDAICKVPGVDAIFIGPDDLSQDLGIPGQLNHPKMIEATEKIFAICKANGVAYGTSCQNPEMAEKRVAQGARWLPYQNDAAMVFNTAKAAVPKLMEIGGRGR
ncbi:HpcH/HpaI aldolase family protein [Shumkonia mesophila]|uniref:HpcH/HpaI aldolase family protein n=1 Tax=Shumkonia mesophila TaxID=2838854 RepID=UPI0029346257|nr:aldolase/citrate lyase family protein [Shumkonia mesophila]